MSYNSVRWVSLKMSLKVDFPHLVWNSQFKLWPSWICDPLNPVPCDSRALLRLLLLCSLRFYWSEGPGGDRQWGKEVSPDISVCITVDQKERKKSGRRKERKCKPSTKPNKKPPKHREQRKEERIFSANTCFLKNTVCVWETQSCLSAVHFKEPCLVSHSSLRKHVKRSPVDFSQGLTSSELFH